MSRPNNPLSVMAAFATFKNMTECKKYKSQYQVLSEFIEHIILKEHLFNFTVSEMQNFLHHYFGFDIPEAVIKTALKCLSYIKLRNHIYGVDHQNLSVSFIDNDIESITSAEEEKSASVIEVLVKFIREKGLADISSEELTQQLVAFLLEEDPNASGKYVRLISEFILLNEDNDSIQLQLNAIREGSILYLGLNHNISEIGSIQKPLTLFLDTEVLFDLAGYNGVIFEMLSTNFLEQVKKANIGKENIRLCYFKEVRQEIDDFFKSAEYIVDNQAPVSEKIAMKAILNGCASSADVRQKKGDFDYRLRFSFGIYEDTVDNYYTPDFEKYNLENADVTDPKDQESWRFISHINKLRKGQIYPDVLASEYILVTKTNNTLCKARELSQRLKVETDAPFVSDCAISVDKMTSYLWLKLGGGFGQSEYPTSIHTITKARIVLATYISRKIETEFREAQRQYQAEEITEEQLAYRILSLRNKPVLPEELEGVSIVESLDFSAEYLRRFEEEVKTGKIKLAEKDEEIEKLNLNSIEEKQKTQAALTKVEELEKQLEAIQKEQQATEDRKSRRKRRIKTGLRILGFVVFLAITTTLVCVAYIKCNPVLSILLAVAEMVGIIFSVRNYVVRFWKQCFPNKKQSSSDNATRKRNKEKASHH